MEKPDAFKDGIDAFVAYERVRFHTERFFIPHNNPFSTAIPPTHAVLIVDAVAVVTEVSEVAIVVVIAATTARIQIVVTVVADAAVDVSAHAGHTQQLS